MKYLKKILLILIILLCIHMRVLAKTPNIDSGSAILIDASTGKILFNKNAYEIMYPASTTKIMTAILTLENCNLDNFATASEYAINSIPPGYSDANIQIGESLTIRDLLYALMLQSANEAATILAEYIAGSEANFAQMMNNKAKEIGCLNTNFVNANGIHNENHVSTAYDLALIGNYAMKNSMFRKIVSTTSYTLPASNKYSEVDRSFSNTNALILFNDTNNYYYPYATGIKTGFTTPAQNCLVSSSSKDGIDLICVVLYSQTTPDGLSERYLDTINLFEYGYNDYSFSTVLNKYSIVETIPLNNSKESLNILLANDLTLLVNKENDNLIENKEINLNDNLCAPIHAGEKVGTVTYTIEGVNYTEDLIAETDISASFSSNLILILIGTFLLLVSIRMFLIN